LNILTFLVSLFRSSHSQNAIETERLAGIAAWRALVANHMIVSGYKTMRWQRRYKWNANEVAHLMGISVEELDYKPTKEKSDD
jgi:hypothetical protein